MMTGFRGPREHRGQDYDEHFCHSDQNIGRRCALINSFSTKAVIDEADYGIANFASLMSGMPLA